MTAPLVMGYLAKQTQQSNVSNSGGLTDMLGNLMGTQGGGSMLTSMIDQNGDGDIKDDLMKMGSSLLGNLFKK